MLAIIEYQQMAYMPATQLKLIHVSILLFPW